MDSFVRKPAHLARAVARGINSSLKLKLALLIVTVVGLTLGIAPWTAIQTQKAQLLASSEEHLRSLHEALRRAIVASCMLTGKPEAVQHVVENVGNSSDIDWVRIFDTAGVVRFSSRPEERGTHLTRAELRRYYGQPESVIVTPRNSGPAIQTLVRPMFNEPMCQHCHPHDGKILDILQVSASLGPMYRQLGKLKRLALLSTGITLVAIVLGVWWSLTVFVDQPLQELVKAMEKTERGDLGGRVEIHGNDELGQLGRNFNTMVAKLQTAQQELERYHQGQLARADRLATIGELAAAIAHEIRNPLTGISGAVSVLGRNLAEDDSRREVVRQTQLLIQRLNKSVEDILIYSRPTEPQLRSVTIGDIADRTLSFVEAQAAKERIRLVKEDHQDPGASRSPAVLADPHQMQQVLMNLILNAIQASEPGTEIHIRTGEGEVNGQKYASIEIEDRGKGMTAEQAAKAFQPFFSTKPHGTGLGLAIAKQIVEQHGGRLTLRSAVGEGTCVRIELPAAVPPAPATES